MSMDLLAHLRQTVAYNAWANEQVAASMQPIARPPAKAVLVLAHIVGAERLWHSRLTEDGSPEVWPALNVAQCVAGMHELRAMWTEWAHELTQQDLHRPVQYINSRGDSWTNTVREIIAHITHHSSYHRGQIATLLGSAGHMPAYTDLIHAVRSNLIESP